MSRKAFAMKSPGLVGFVSLTHPHFFFEPWPNLKSTGPIHSREQQSRALILRMKHIIQYMRAKFTEYVHCNESAQVHWSIILIWMFSMVWKRCNEIGCRRKTIDCSVTSKHSRPMVTHQLFLRSAYSAQAPKTAAFYHCLAPSRLLHETAHALNCCYWGLVTTDQLFSHRLCSYLLPSPNRSCLTIRLVHSWLLIALPLIITPRSTLFLNFRKVSFSRKNSEFEV